ncbi:MAG: RNA 2',3'-cyclic phosphodiesterase [Deltaproteobacteria bacterium]|uniref:RNA 2',3'-cyclic phosphodiesterase n=1 Tax=Candidatus Zymogenus saltonus TaxID=2844893 RepID=A0A9D8KEF3_9DELT|nr:RNA 2',3'-cyclic phosphodiesterase [Candidatus Zymogenus saltonus]
MADLRLFIAAEITEEMRSKLGELIEKLSSPEDGVKWVRPGAIHLTLKFLGSVKEGDLKKVTEAGEEGVSGFKGMDDISLTVKELGTFPGGNKSRGARVIWVGLDGDIERLGAIRDSLEETFSKIGFPREDRDFRPHLTLGRVKGRADRRMIERIEGMKDIILGDIRVSGLHLFKSDLRPTGAVYTSLFYYPFG